MSQQQPCIVRPAPAPPVPGPAWLRSRLALCAAEATESCAAKAAVSEANLRRPTPMWAWLDAAKIKAVPRGGGWMGQQKVVPNFWFIVEMIYVFERTKKHNPVPPTPPKGRCSVAIWCFSKFSARLLQSPLRWQVKTSVPVPAETTYHRKGKEIAANLNVQVGIVLQRPMDFGTAIFFLGSVCRLLASGRHQCSFAFFCACQWPQRCRLPVEQITSTAQSHCRVDLRRACLTFGLRVCP